MTSPTPNPERRKTPRTTVNGLAYINLDSNNGAIVLNVSMGGLCFHSVAPVQRTEAIHFWFSHDNRRIDADGQLAWMDEKQKTVGLRFANLSTEARRQIRGWMDQPATPAAPGAARSAASLSPQTESSKLPNRNAVQDRSAAVEVPSPKRKAPELLRGFSAGLVFGILVSTLVAAAILLSIYRHEIGSSLIQLGEQLGGRFQSKTVSAVPETASAPLASNFPPAKLPTQPPTKAVQTQHVKPVAPVPMAATREPTTAASVAAPTISSLPPPTSSPKTSVKPEASDISGKAVMVPKIEPANPPGTHARDSAAVETGSYSTMYLEVGKFHDVTLADHTTNRLYELGFHATVVHKGHLWTNSYQVLVGPYSTDDEAKAARQVLVSRGFTPRAFERGSRTFWFPSRLTFHGTHIPDGDCVISWESYVTDAVVKIQKDGSAVITAEGKWVKLGAKFEWNAIVYQNNPDGSGTLLEIRFAGMNRALVFGESS